MEKYKCKYYLRTKDLKIEITQKQFKEIIKELENNISNWLTDFIEESNEDGNFYHNLFIGDFGFYELIVQENF